MISNGYHKQAAKELHVRNYNVYKGRKLCGNFRAMLLLVLWIP
jgi:hypothetical protein